MDEIKILTVGAVKEVFYRAKIDELIKKINRKNKISITEIPDESIPKNAGDTIVNQIKDKEGRKLLEHIQNTDYVVVLCIDGKMTISEKIKGLVDEAEARGKNRLVFVIGGSLGLASEVIKRGDYKMSFSNMTFPHQLMRVMLLEQLEMYL